MAAMVQDLGGSPEQGGTGPHVRGLALHVVLIAGLLMVSAGGAAAQVCAPLQGTASYSQCINDQLTRMRTDPLVPPPDPRLRETTPTATIRPVPRPQIVPQPDYLNTNPSLQVPTYDPSGAATAARNTDSAQRNSDLRTNLLRQQVQRDLITGPTIRTAPSMQIRPVAPMKIP